MDDPPKAGGKHFLELPAGKYKRYSFPADVDPTNFAIELRNKIYDYLAEDEVDREEITIRLRHSAQGRRSRRTSSNPRFPDSSLSLTQTCRQIRQEYLPMIQRARSVRVPLDQLHDYLDTFHPPEDPADPHLRPSGNIEPFWSDIAFPDPIDILSLAKIVHGSPDLHIRFQKPDPEDVLDPERHELSLIKTIIDTYPKWRVLEQDADIQGIYLSSRTQLRLRAEYERTIRMECAKYDIEDALGTWIFRTKIADLEGLRIVAEDDLSSHSWKTVYRGRVNYRLGNGGEHMVTYRMERNRSHPAGWIARV